MDEQEPLPLVFGESPIGEMFVTTSDVRIRGFQWVGTGHQGKLVLTSYRLFYCFYDHRAFAFALEPSDVVSIDLKPRSFFSITARIVITARLGGGQPRRIVFTVPKQAVITMTGTIRTYTNPYTPEEFAGLLQEWRSRGDASDDTARAELAEQKRRIYAAILAGETKAAFVRVLITMPLATCVMAGPIFGFLARRDARRLNGMSESQGVAAPARVAWIARLGMVSIVLGFLSWAMVLVGLFNLD